MLRIELRQWVAVWYRCPDCGAQSAETMLTPWRYSQRHLRECYSYKHDRCALEVVERRWYSTFCIEPGVSTTVAGTLGAIGPFKICDIVQPNIRAFRKWYRLRRSEADERTRQYLEQQSQAEARYKLVQEAEAVVYRRFHAVELIAEQVARSVWPESQPQTDDFDPFF